MTDEPQRQEQDSLPWANHRALVSLQGWTSAAVRGRNKFTEHYFRSTIWRRPLEAAKNHSTCYVQLNRRGSWWHRPFILSHRLPTRTADLNPRLSIAWLNFPAQEVVTCTEPVVGAARDRDPCRSQSTDSVINDTKGRQYESNRKTRRVTLWCY